MITVTARRTLGVGPDAAVRGIRAAHADLLDTLPGIRLPDLDQMRERGVLGGRPTAPGLPLRGPHGVKGDAVTHALAKPDARPDKVQQWADHKDPRTTQLYNRRRELLDDSPGYGLAAAVTGALTTETS